MENQPIYRERLWPNAYVWLFAVLMLAAIAIAAGNVYGYNTALVIFVSSIALLGASVALTTLTIQVTPDYFVVGRARLPLQYVGQTTVLDRENTIRARSRDAHPDAYFAIRSWIAQSVIVVVTDESDPHPYWHISSRHPETLVTALKSVQKS